MNTQFERENLQGPGKDEWLTPPYILKALGEFDLDPCSPVNRPWPTAKKHYTYIDNGLFQEWQGRVWCNPPYGNKTWLWFNKCAIHGNCIMLTFARTETKMFFDYVWNNADALFFFKGRLVFYNVDGTEGGGRLELPQFLLPTAWRTRLF